MKRGALKRAAVEEIATLLRHDVERAERIQKSGEEHATARAYGYLLASSQSALERLEALLKEAGA